MSIFRTSVGVIAAITACAIPTSMSPAQASSPAAAAGLSTRAVSGSLRAISCMSARACVLVGMRIARDGNTRGEVIPVASGVPGRVALVPGTEAVTAVSCPSASGCVAVAYGSAGGRLRTEFLTIGRSGAVTSSTWVDHPTQAIFGLISCTSLTSCEVAGAAGPIYIGMWNGAALTMHSVAKPRRATGLEPGGLSCAGSHCELVGPSAESTSGFILAIRDGLPGKIRVLHGYGLDGISCVSRSRCYAVGFSPRWSVLTTVRAGRPGPLRKGTASFRFRSIACAGTECTAAGGRYGRRLGPGLLDGIVAGRVMSLTVIQRACCFVSVARAGGFIAAVSSTDWSDTSQVTTGR
jgi:hypothetical protein